MAEAQETSLCLTLPQATGAYGATEKDNMNYKDLLDEETATGAGDSIRPDETYASTIIFEVEGTASSFTIDVKAQYRSGGSEWPVAAVNVKDRLQTTQITEAGVYIIDGTGLYEVFPDVDSISGGNVTVRAKERVG